LEIWPNQAYGRVVFIPPFATTLCAPVDQVSINLHGIIEADDLPAKVSYTAWRQDPAIALPVPLRTSSIPFVESLPPSVELGEEFADQWQRLTDLPTLDPRIEELSARVVAGAETDGEKIAAVQRYFLENYQYAFGIEIPLGEDPLTYFLLNRPPAHCEYFASGAAILLRCAGVRCRYVTGFVASEKNTVGGYWVARNRDAHAWVEAHDSDRGWVLVEATPTGGLPEPTPSSAFRQMWDSLQANWQRFVASVRQNGISAIAWSVAGLFRRPVTLVVLFLAASAFALRRFIRRRRSTRTVEQNPLVLRLHTLLRQVDRRCGKAGLVRQPHETFHQFARRVESAGEGAIDREAANWYRDFAAVRYGGHVDDQTVKRLEEAFATMSARAIESA
jgi:transglutaminase-like putative cysteine protease